MTRADKFKTRGVRPPTDAHYCFECKTRLAANFEVKRATATVRQSNGYDGVETWGTYTGKIYGYGYGSHGFFCSLRCGYEYGRTWARQRADDEQYDREQLAKQSDTEE